MSRPRGRLAILRYHDALAFAVLRPVRTEMIEYVPVSFMLMPNTDPVA